MLLPANAPPQSNGAMSLHLRHPSPMPRRPRSIIPAVPLHITQRGVNRCVTFLDESDFATYLWALRAAASRAQCAVHAYVLMTNHVHLLVTPSDASGPATLMRALGAWYVRYFNDRYRRSGYLWEGRYRSQLITSGQYFFACSRYIERNPVRAGITDDPSAYIWSSFRCNAFGERDAILTPHPLYAALGSDYAARSIAYRQLFGEEVTARDISEVRTAPLQRGRLAVGTYDESVAAIRMKT